MRCEHKVYWEQRGEKHGTRLHYARQSRCQAKAVMTVRQKLGYFPWPELAEKHYCEEHARQCVTDTEAWEIVEQASK